MTNPKRLTPPQKKIKMCRLVDGAKSIPMKLEKRSMNRDNFQSESEDYSYGITEVSDLLFNETITKNPS